MKNRFIIFAGDDYYPPYNGIQGASPTLEEAVARIVKKYDGYYKDRIFVDDCKYGRDWAYIIDAETLEEVYSIQIK